MRNEKSKRIVEIVVTAIISILGTLFGVGTI